MEGGFLGLLLSPIQLALGEINSVVTAEQAPSAPPITPSLPLVSQTNCREPPIRNVWMSSDTIHF